jgi:phosphoribosylformylglycinamidine cyclo-ligase
MEITLSNYKSFPHASLFESSWERNWLHQKTTRHVCLPIGYFANVIDVGKNTGCAMTTDGVGTKVLIAQMMAKYDTIGIDCVAMNVNDLLCVGAVPISMVDCISMNHMNESVYQDILKGLAIGAALANISIVGGETSIMPNVITGYRDAVGFDLVGSAIGLVPLDKIIIGQNIEKWDVLIGIESSGIHSNGLTHAMDILSDGCDFSFSIKSMFGEEHIFMLQKLKNSYRLMSP